MELSAFCLYPLTNTTVTPSSNRNPLPHSKVIREVIQLLESDLISPPTLEEIAHKLRQNPFQLSRRFSAEMGHGIPEHLRKARIQRASALLSSSDLSISEIALEVGYNSFSAFTRAFVREQNQSPSAFRRSLQAS